MKRVTEKEILQHQRRMRKWRRRHLKLAAKARGRAIRELRELLSGRPKPFKIHAPDVIELRAASREKTLRFLHALRVAVADRRPRVTIDFRRTHKLGVMGTLLFYSELVRLQEFAGGVTDIKFQPPANAQACEVLQQIGVYARCGMKETVLPTSDDVVSWKVAMGVDADNEPCGDAMEDYDGDVGSARVDTILRGLAEAMTNTKHHADLLPRLDGLNFTAIDTKWVMFSQLRAPFLHVAFCDLGAGIPATLEIKRPSLWEKLVSLNMAGSDADAISAAVEDSHTRTKLAERGLGLGNILELVKTSQRARVVIYSNRGFYSADYGKAKPKIENFKDSVLGTLIYWRVPLQGVTDHGS